MVQHNRTVLRVVIALSLFFGCFCASGAKAQAGKTYKIPWVEGMVRSPRVRIAFPGGKTLLFEVDTGAPLTVIDRKAAMELKLPILKAELQGAEGMAEVILPPISLGPDVLALPNTPICLVDLSAIRSYAADTAGILGMDVLSQYSLRLDYSAKQIELIQGSVKGTANEPVGMEKLPLTHSGGHYQFSGSLDGVRSEFNLDTGAVSTYVNDADVLKQLKPRALLDKFDVIGFTELFVTGKKTAQRMRLGELSIGRFRFKNPVVMREGLPLPGIWLGSDFLQRFHLLVDFPAQTLYLAPDPAFQDDLMEWDTLAGSPALAASGGAARRAGRIGAISFTVMPGMTLPLVSLSLRGGKPHLFAIDPSRASCLLDAEFLKSEMPAIRTLKTEAGTEVRGVLANATFQAPTPFTIEQIPFGTEDFSDVRKAAQADIVGVLGANLLRAFVERIDFSQHQIEFFDREGFVPPDKAQVLPLQADEGLYYLNAQLDGVLVRFKMRFAAPDTLLQTLPQLTNLKPAAQLQDLTASGAPGSKRLRLHDMRIAGITWESPVLEYSADPSDYDNLLGMDFFSRFHVTLDLSGKRLYLEPDPNYQEDLGKWLGTGFSVEMRTDGKLYISNILSPSPASEAGVAPNDEIVEINGLPIATTPIATIAASSKHAVGVVVTLKVLRKGEEKPREFTMTMRKLL